MLSRIPDQDNEVGRRSKIDPLIASRGDWSALQENLWYLPKGKLRKFVLAAIPVFNVLHDQLDNVKVAVKRSEMEWGPPSKVDPRVFLPNMSQDEFHHFQVSKPWGSM